MTSRATGGPETRVNTWTSGNQQYSTVTALADGGWVVTWASDGQEGVAGWGMYQQRYDSRGKTIGSETHVNTWNPGSQVYSATTALADGGWVVTWHGSGKDDGYGIFQQRYDAEGATVGVENRVNTWTSDVQTEPSTTALVDGGWVVTWEGPGKDDNYGIYQQRYDVDGVADGKETLVNTNKTYRQQTSSVTALADGGWVVTWASDFGTSNHDVCQQRYDAGGSAVGSEAVVNTYTSSEQFLLSTMALADGGWVVAWTSLGQGESVSDIYQQRFDDAGDVIGEETLVSSHAKGDQFIPTIAALADGGWVVSWYAVQSGSSDVYQQRYDADGDAIGSETRVNLHTTGNQQTTGITALEDGGWVVSWESENQNGGGYDIYQRHFAKDVRGTAMSESLTGTRWGEYLVGYDGNDKLDGKGGADVMAGGFGNDTYIVDNVDDQAQELPGQGTDIVQASVSYSLAKLGAVENLTLTGSKHIDGTGNALANILIGNAGENNLNGASGNDTINGGSGDDRLDGGKGNDRLTGGFGKDMLIGGAGRDQFIFSDTDDSGIVTAQRDIIVDFVHGTDRIDLSAIDANEVAFGKQSLVLDGKGTSSTNLALGHIGWYQDDRAGTANDTTRLRINTDKDQAIEMNIELSGLITLTKDDFALL